MLAILVYPVSAVLKLWHWLLADVLQVPASGAWVASVILLVVTVRLLIAPFTWQIYKTTRIAFLARPHVAEAIAGVEDPKEAGKIRQQVLKEHGYNPLASCVPALIQIPVFLGLYRLVLWLAGPDATDGRNIGMLTQRDIASFQESTLFGVPLPAYVAMDDAQFVALGTTEAQVRAVAIPLLIAAMIFTSGNMVLGNIRSRSTLDWDKTFLRRMYYALYWLAPLTALMLLLIGLTGLVPVALLLYWVTGNLWTLCQTALLWALTVRRFPAEQIHREYWLAAKQRAERARRTKSNNPPEEQ
jgi:YidC/Oxa1 family membrane protein insertase